MTKQRNSMPENLNVGNFILFLYREGSGKGIEQTIIAEIVKITEDSIKVRELFNSHDEPFTWSQSFITGSAFKFEVLYKSDNLDDMKEEYSEYFI